MDNIKCQERLSTEGAGKLLGGQGIGPDPVSYTHLRAHETPEHLRFMCLVSSLFFCLVPCGRLSWLLVSFWAHVNIVHHIILWPNGSMDQDETWRR